MTIYERLFGTPERAARTLEEGMFNSVDYCYMLNHASHREADKCKNCLYECDRYESEPKDITLLDWLSQEVVE